MSRKLRSVLRISLSDIINSLLTKLTRSRSLGTELGGGGGGGGSVFMRGFDCVSVHKFTR